LGILISFHGNSIHINIREWFTSRRLIVFSASYSPSRL
jgi:hypothetical protein